MAEASNKFDYTKLNTLAVVSLASAATLFGAPAAVISGHISLAQLKDSNEKGRWMAITGLVIGYFGIAVALVATIVNVALRARHGSGFMDDDMRMPWGDHGHRSFEGDEPQPLPFPTDPMPDPTVTPMPGTN
jgi:hypothetical protein